MSVIKKDSKDAKYTQATGRRKEAIASVRLMAGSGKTQVNGLPLEQYFVTDLQRHPLKRPFTVTDTSGKFDVIARVVGGGKDAQSGAMQLAVSRALVKINAELAPKLHEFHLLTRDPRMKERKKYGKHGARRGTQFSKR